MDLWDLTKLLLRRWYVLLPLLLASATAILLGGSAVKPDYRATGHVQLIPPVVERSPTATVHNPWLNLGMQALGQAVILNVQGERVSRALVAAGLTENFAVSMEDRETFFSIESVGRTPQQATATTRRLMDLLRTQVWAQQSRFGVVETDLITTLDLDNGDEVEPITTTRKRFLVAAIGVCLLCTVAITVCLDALLGWRGRRRKSKAESVNPPPQPAGSSSDDLTDGVHPDPVAVPAGARKIRAPIPALSPSPVSSAPGLPEVIRNASVAREPATVSVEHRVSDDGEHEDDATVPRAPDPALGQKNKGR